MEVAGINTTPMVHLPHKHAKRHSVMASIGTVIYCISSKQTIVFIFISHPSFTLTWLQDRLVPLITPRHGPRRKHSSSFL
jgi:hypothetical protein